MPALTPAFFVLGGHCALLGFAALLQGHHTLLHDSQCVETQGVGDRTRLPFPWWLSRQNGRS
jgi:hypothetical protein